MTAARALSLIDPFELVEFPFIFVEFTADSVVVAILCFRLLLFVSILFALDLELNSVCRDVLRVCLLISLEGRIVSLPIRSSSLLFGLCVLSTLSFKCVVLLLCLDLRAVASTMISGLLNFGPCRDGSL